MARARARDDEPQPDGSRSRATDQPTPADDTEGHMFQPDLGTSRHLAKNRSAEIERDLRARKNEKEARPNRR